jgi:hypothetical protein
MMEKGRTYYEYKVFSRAEGILDSCMVSRKRYAWMTEAGLRRLVFITEKDTPEENVGKAVEFMNRAFRKARCRYSVVTQGPYFGCHVIYIDIPSKEVAV